MNRPEASYLALGDEAAMIEDYTASFEAQALTHDILTADDISADAFTGDWLSSGRVTLAGEFADAASAHARARTAPVTRSEEVSAAYKRAFLVLERLSEATAAALCGQACEVEWCDDDDDGATEPFASLLFRGGPLDGSADDGGAGQPLENTLGSCHQCKRKTIIRRCQRQRSTTNTSLWETMTESRYVCRRAFCAACVKKYPPLDEDGSDQSSGIFCCPTCRGLCSCRACSRARVGGPKKLKGRPEQWIGREEPWLDPSSAAEPNGDVNVHTLLCEPNGEPLSLPDAFDGEPVAPRAADLDASADQRPPASDRPLPSARSCRARCPACQHRHKLRIAFCEPPEAAKVLVPYRCVKCARAFGLVLTLSVPQWPSL